MSSTDIYRFYIYAYIRTKDSKTAKAGTPYYIGKGTGNRAWNISSHSIKPNKELTNIIILETNLTNVGALALERRYIKWWGRQDNKTGILRNKTDGGDGGYGIIFNEEQLFKMSPKGRKHSLETKQKIKNSHIGKKLSDVTKQKISSGRKGISLNSVSQEKAAQSNTGKKRSAETKLKMKENHWSKNSIMKQEISDLLRTQFKGIPKSEEHKAALRKPKTKIQCPHCQMIGSSSIMKRWHFDECKLRPDSKI